MALADGVRVAVIPARGGSKRVPRKNIRQVGGRALLAWTIDTCVRSGLFDRVIVSTDDEEITQIALASGAEVPFQRDADLADDHTGLVPVVADTVRRLEDRPEPTVVCCVYPTAIGLLPSDLAESAALLVDPSSYVVAVTRYSHPIQRAMARDQNGRLSMLRPNQVNRRTQDLEATWYDAGQLIWGAAATWLAQLPVLTNAVGYELPSWRSVDLDTEEDFVRAELLHRYLQSLR